MAQAPSRRFVRGDRIFIDFPGGFVFWINVYSKRDRDSKGNPIPPEKQKFELSYAFPKMGPDPARDPNFMLCYSSLADIATKNFGSPNVVEALQPDNKRFAIRDGDAPRYDATTGQMLPPRGFLRGHWFISLRSYDPIGVGVLDPATGQMRNAIEADLYPGAFCKLSAHVRASDYGGNLSVSFFAESIVKTRDGPVIQDKSGGANRPLGEVWGTNVAPAPMQAPAGYPSAAQAPAFGVPQPAPAGFPGAAPAGYPGAPAPAPAFGAPAPAFGAPAPMQPAPAGYPGAPAPAPMQPAPAYPAAPMSSALPPAAVAPQFGAPAAPAPQSAPAGYPGAAPAPAFGAPQSAPAGYPGAPAPAPMQPAPAGYPGAPAPMQPAPAGYPAAPAGYPNFGQH